MAACASIGDILAAKGIHFAKPETVPKLKTKSRTSRADSQNVAVVQWIDESFGDLRVAIMGASAGETETRGGKTWTPVRFNKMGDEITLVPQVEHLDNILVFRAVGSDVFEDITTTRKLPAFKIKVGRNKDGSLRTYDRNRDGQNDFRIDFVNLNGGLTVVVEVSFIIRDGQAWVCTDESYVGNCVIFVDDEASGFPEDRKIIHQVEDVELVASMLPATDIYAHEDANPFSVFQECRKLLQHAIKAGCATSLLADLVVPTWAPTWPSSELAPTLVMGVTGSWQPAVVKWFNSTLGYGFAKTQNGDSVFCHFGQMRLPNGKKPSEHGELAQLHPMQQVFVKTESNGRGGLKANLIVAFD